MCGCWMDRWTGGQEKKVHMNRCHWGLREDVKIGKMTEEDVQGLDDIITQDKGKFPRPKIQLFHSRWKIL